jgi:hypothetical protein
LPRSWRTRSTPAASTQPSRARKGGATTLTTAQTFATVQDLYAQLVNARVWIGFHYRNSVVAGENLGTAVAKWELHRYFLPTR